MQISKVKGPNIIFLKPFEQCKKKWFIYVNFDPWFFNFF